MKASQLAALTLAIGLALGTTAGLWMGRGLGPTGTDSGGGNPLSPNDTRTVLQQPGQGITTQLADVDGPTRVAQATSSAAAQARSLTRRAAERATAEEVDSSGWTHELSGWVLDENGNPIEGAAVSSSNIARTRSRPVIPRQSEDVGRGHRPVLGRGDSIEEMEASVVSWIEGQLNAARDTRTARTDAAGRFVLKDLRDDLHSIEAYAEGYVIAPRTAELGEAVELTGKPIQILSLDVRLPDGTEPTEAIVTIPRKHYQEHYAWSPETRTVRLRVRSEEFMVYAGNVQKLGSSDLTATYQSGPVTTDPKGAQAAPILVMLEPARLLEVNITDSSTLRPRLQPWVAIASSGEGEIDWGSASVRRLHHHGPGVYVLKDPAEGDFVLGVGRGRAQRPEILRQVQIRDASKTVEVALGEPDLSRTLIVHCTGPSGRPASDLSFRYRSIRIVDGQAARGAGSLQAMERNRGTYWIDESEILRRKTWETRGQVTLLVKSPTFGVAETSVDKHTREVTISFQAPCELAVNWPRDTAPEYGVRLAPEGHGAGELSSPRQPIDGRLSNVDGAQVTTFTGLQPGTYELLLERDASDLDGLRHRLRTITLRQGRTEIAVTLPTLHQVEAIATGALPGTSLRLTQVGGDPDDGYLAKRASTDGEGRAVFGEVPSGAYTLWSPSYRGIEKAVQVPSGEVTFQINAPNSLQVRRVEQGGPAARAGLQSGDVITHVNGKAPVGDSAASVAAAKVATGQATLTVLRGGRLLDISLGPVGETSSGAPNLGCSFRAHYLQGQ